MAKKNKSKKLAKEKTSGNQGMFGANLRQAGTVAAAALVGEIVEATVERLIQKSAQSKKDSGHPSQGRVEDAALKLQDNVKGVKPTIKDAADTVRESLGDIKPTLTDVASSLKEATQETIQRSLAAVGNPAELSVESVANTAKTVMSAVSHDSSGKSKGKKKGKKKS